MPKFVGQVEKNPTGGVLTKTTSNRVVIEGETLKDAMERAGYMPLTQHRNVNRLVGKLTTGQRYSFRIQPAQPEEL